MKLTKLKLKEIIKEEILKERMEVLREVNEYIGKYYSIDWVRKNILKFNETEIKEMDNDMAKEKEDGLYNEGEEDY